MRHMTRSSKSLAPPLLSERTVTEPDQAKPNPALVLMFLSLDGKEAHHLLMTHNSPSTGLISRRSFSTPSVS